MYTNVSNTLKWLSRGGGIHNVCPKRASVFEERGQYRTTSSVKHKLECTAKKRENVEWIVA